MLTAGAGRFEALVDLAVMLRRGDVDLDDLVLQIKKNKSHHCGSDPEIVSLHHNTEVERKIISKKRRRTPCAPDQEHDEKPIKKLIFKIDGKVVSPPAACQRIKKPATFTPLLLTEEIKKQILDLGGVEESITSVIEKALFNSDVDPAQGRFSIPYGQVNPHLLKTLLESEVALLDSGGIPVTFFGSRGTEHSLRFRNWESNNLYVLVGGWKKVCTNSQLEKGQTVQLWSFRTNQQQLCFALF